jgi:hypothetical protein
MLASSKPFCEVSSGPTVLLNLKLERPAAEVLALDRAKVMPRHTFHETTGSSLLYLLPDGLLLAFKVLVDKFVVVFFGLNGGLEEVVGLFSVFL